MTLRFKRRTISPGWHVGVFRQGHIVIVDVVRLRFEVALVRAVS